MTVSSVGRTRHIGDRVKLVRTAAGLKMNAFARSVRVSPGYIGHIESQRRQPSAMFIDNISMKFGIRVAWLETGLGWMYSPAFPLDAVSWFAGLLQSGRVERVAVVTYEGGESQEHKGLLIMIREGVLSAAIGPRTTSYEDVGTLAYGTVLERLQRWDGMVGQVIVTPEESRHLDEIDLSSLAKRALFGQQIFEDELRRTRFGDFTGSPVPWKTQEGPHGAEADANLNKLPEEIVQPNTALRVSQVPGAPPSVQTPVFSQITAQYPELETIVQLLLDADLETRTLVNRILLARREIREIQEATHTLLKPPTLSKAEPPQSGDSGTN